MIISSQSHVAQTLSNCIAKDAHALVIFLPLPPKCWEYSYAPLCPSCVIIFLMADGEILSSARTEARSTLALSLLHLIISFNSKVSDGKVDA